MYNNYLKNQITDSTAQQLDSLSLDLIEVEDKSSLIIPDKPKRNYVPKQQEPQETHQDSFQFNFELKNIPTRQVKKAITNQTTTKVEQVLFVPKEKNKNTNSWETILLLIAFFIIAFIKAFSPTRFRQIFKSLFSFYSAQEVVREEKVFFHRANFSMFFLFVLTSSLFIGNVFGQKYFEALSVFNYLQIAAVILLIYFIKFTSSSILASVFSVSGMVSTYIYNVLIYNYLVAFLLLPCLVLMYYSPFNPSVMLNYIIVPLLIIILTFRLLRLYVIGRENSVLNFYIILYICTLEILPLVVLGKIFILK